MFLVGICHKSAPVPVREKLFLKPLERELLLSNFSSNPSIIEAIVLSTCNRTEIYINALPGMAEDLPMTVLKALFDVKKCAMTEDVLKHFYKKFDQSVVKHLLRLAGGLESLILGEKQILGQLKEAIALSRKMGMLNKEFNILVNSAIRTGKKAQTETKIGYGGVSVSWAAVQAASEDLGTLKDKAVLVVGAGKMSKLALNYLNSKGIGKLYIVNRTYEHAEAVAREYKATPVSFANMKDVLKTVDVCIFSSGCPYYLLEREDVDQVMQVRKDERMVVIDISLPRNVNPNVGLVKNVTLFSIDELDKVVEKSLGKRKKAILEVELIIAEKFDQFYNKLERIARFERSQASGSFSKV